MQNFKAYGFKTIQVNGFILFTCNISVDRIANSDLPTIEGMTMHQTEKRFGKNKIVKETTNFCYTTMSYSDHSRMQILLGLFLEQYAISKIKTKFGWAHPEQQVKVVYDSDDLCF